MALSEKIVFKIYAGLVGAATTIAAQRLVTMLWEASTGDVPPNPNDPEVPLTRALIWAAASGLGVGMSQLAMNRLIQQRWAANTGHEAPGQLHSILDIAQRKGK